MFIPNLRRGTALTVSDRWQKFLCPFGWNEPDVRKSSDRKTEHFELALVDHIPEYTTFCQLHVL